MATKAERPPLNLAELPSLALDVIVDHVARDDADGAPLLEQFPSDLFALTAACRSLRHAALKTLVRYYTIARVHGKSKWLMLDLAFWPDGLASDPTYICALEAVDDAEQRLAGRPLPFSVTPTDPAELKQGKPRSLAVPASWVRGIHLRQEVVRYAKERRVIAFESVLASLRSLRRIQFGTRTPAEWIQRTLREPSIPSRLFELEFAHVAAEELAWLANMSLPNVCVLRIHGHDTSVYQHLPDLPSCRVLELDCELQIGTVDALRRFLGLTTHLEVLKITTPVELPRRVLAHVDLDAEFPQRFARMERVLLGARTYRQLVPTGGPGTALRIKHLRLIDDIGMSLPIPSHWLDSLPDLMSLDLDHLDGTGAFLLPQHVVQIAALPRLRYLDAVVYPRAEVGDEVGDWDDDDGSDSSQVDGDGAGESNGGENGEEHPVPDMQGIQFPALVFVRSSRHFFHLLHRATLPALLEAAVIVDAEPATVHLPTMPILDNLVLVSETGVDRRHLPLTIAADLTVATPQLSGLHCHVPVNFTHTLAHPMIDDLTMPSPSWNRLRGSIDLPALANLAIVTPTHHRAEPVRHLQVLESGRASTTLHTITFPNPMSMDLMAVWDLTSLPAVDDFVAFNLSILAKGGNGEVRLAYSRMSPGVWTELLGAHVDGAVSQATIVIPNADVLIDRDMFVSVAKWAVLEKAPRMCIEAPADVYHALGVKRIVEDLQVTYGGVGLAVEAKVLSEVRTTDQ
ncbi:hypothetical protein GGF31_006121 [Allomyces arbusculus]|nr:hypothetical protein GGF31_006121 [Allomyces arbusculus]